MFEYEFSRSLIWQSNFKESNGKKFSSKNNQENENPWSNDKRKEISLITRSKKLSRRLISYRQGKLSSIEPHVVRSNSLEALSTNMTKNRLRLFATLVERRPTNLTELAHLLQKDYALVRRDARILEGMGLIKLEKVGKEAHNKQGSKVKFSEVKPVPLYKRIIFDFPVAEPVSVKKKFLNSHRPRFAVQ